MIEREVQPAARASHSALDSQQKIPNAFSPKKFCNDFRSNAQQPPNTCVDAHTPSAHNALTSLQPKFRGCLLYTSAAESATPAEPEVIKKGKKEEEGEEGAEPEAKGKAEKTDKGEKKK